MEELTEKRKKKYKIIRMIIQIIILILLIGALIYGTIKLFPVFLKIQNDEEYRNYIIGRINNLGSWSWLAIILAQIIQTIFAIIPSGPIVMISGVMFTPAVAVILCVVGQTLGGLCVYFLIKLFGVRFLALFIDPDKIKESRFLKNETRCEVLMFGYLLIPALPKDIVSFVAPFTKITPLKFTIINLIARIPMTIVTVFLGSSLITGAYHIAIILGSISFVLALICFIFNNKIVKLLEGDKKSV